MKGEVESILHNVAEEFFMATKKFGSFASTHEGIAVLREEYLELEREVFWGTKERACAEAIQVAAMAVRFIHDCCTEG